MIELKEEKSTCGLHMCMSSKTKTQEALRGSNTPNQVTCDRQAWKYRKKERVDNGEAK